MFKLRRMRAMDPLQVAMTGVRMGERYLQVFCSDVVLTSGLATKTGLSGVTAIAVPDEKQAARARSAAEKAGVLLDVKMAPVTTLEWPDASFDMVVIDNTDGGLSSLAPRERMSVLQSALGVLRPGGRIEIIERVGGALFGGAPATDDSSGGAEGALRAAGFNPVRTLAEKGGFRFVEGLSPSVHLSGHSGGSPIS